MGAIDARGRLEERPVSYRESKDGQVCIAWHGRPALTLRGGLARCLLARLDDLDEAGI